MSLSYLINEGLLDIIKYSLRKEKYDELSHQIDKLVRKATKGTKADVGDAYDVMRAKQKKLEDLLSPNRARLEKQYPEVYRDEDTREREWRRRRGLD